MLDAGYAFINEDFDAESISPQQLDRLLADGWRHFGTRFFRYSLAFHELEMRRVIPLRIPLARFSISKSQRRVLRRNRDAEAAIAECVIDTQAEELFHLHKQRFKRDVPASVRDFIGVSRSPVDTRELRVSLGGRRCAISYFDVGENSVSGVYAMFDPSLANRSLGIFTILKEIEFAIENEKDFYYLGYCYEGNSFYDYKKRFRAAELYDWRGTWTPM